MSKILLIGKNGQLGWELLHALPCLGEVQALDRHDIDLSDGAAIRDLVRTVRPEIIVNAAAYTNVDGAESNVDVAMNVNGVGPGILARELRSAGGKLIVHYSTDYVFNGNSERPYTEEDPVDPVNAYGLTKLAGEQEIAASGCPHLIFRTQWLYASRAKNFLLSILKLAREGKPLRVVYDQFGAPTNARMLAELTALALRKARSEAVQDISGIYHVSAAGQTSWYEFTRAILEEASAIFEQPAACYRSALQSLLPVTTREYAAAARRPAHSVLSNDKLARIFGLRMTDWHHQLRSCLEEVRGATAPARVRFRVEQK